MNGPHPAPAGAPETTPPAPPVEIQVVGELGEEHARQLAEYVFARLETALRNRG